MVSIHPARTSSYESPRSTCPRISRTAAAASRASGESDIPAIVDRFASIRYFRTATLACTDAWPGVV